MAVWRCRLTAHVSLATAVTELLMDKHLHNNDQRRPGELYPINDPHSEHVFTTMTTNRTRSGRTQEEGEAGRLKGVLIRFLQTLTMAVWNWLVPNKITWRDVLYRRMANITLPGRVLPPLNTGRARLLGDAR